MKVIIWRAVYKKRYIRDIRVLYKIYSKKIGENKKTDKPNMNKNIIFHNFHNNSSEYYIIFKLLFFIYYYYILLYSNNYSGLYYYNVYAILYFICP